MAICGGALEQTCVVTRAEREDPASGERQHALRAGRPPLVPPEQARRPRKEREARDDGTKRACGALPARRVGRYMYSVRVS